MRFAKLSPVPLYLAVTGLTEVFLMSWATLVAVYRINEADFNPLQLILAGAVLELSAFVFEVPTGVAADTYGRRLSVIVGLLLIGVAFVIEGLFPVFWIILMTQVVWGLGSTFISGAQEAWVSDEIGNEGVGRVFLLGTQVGLVGGLIGIGIAVVLGKMSLALPIVFAGVGFIGLAVFLMFAMPERGFSPAPQDSMRISSAMSGTLSSGVGLVRQRRILIVILSISFLYGAAVQPLGSLWPIHLLTNFTFPSTGGLDTVAWFGLIQAGALLLGVVAVEIIRRYIAIDRGQVAVYVLIVLNVFKLISYMTIALTRHFAIAVSARLVETALERASGPVSTAWTNQYADSDVRATVLSMSAQSNALGRGLISPVMGLMANLTTIRAALVATSSLLLIPLTVLVWLVRGK